MSSYIVKELPAIDEHMGFNFYEGYMLDDVKQGPGRYKWADGQVTIGEWKDGECCAFTAELQKRCLHGISGHATRAKKVSVPTSSNNDKVNRKKTVDYCISCKTQCTFIFQCLNCNTGYCQTCEKKFEVHGFKKRGRRANA